MRLLDKLRRRAIGAAAAMAFVAGASVAYADDPGVTSDQILIGGSYALSGPVRFITEPFEQGAKTVFNEVNEGGGVHGRKIKWLIEDDAYQAARTLASVKKLVDRDGVFLIFGVVGQAPTNAVTPFADSNKIPALVVVPSKDPSPYVFGMIAPYSELSYVLTKQLIQNGAKHIGYLYQNDDLGEAGRSGLERALKEGGIELTAAVGYEKGTADLTTSVLKLRDAKVDTVVHFGTGPSVAAAIKQAGAVGYKPQWGTYNTGTQKSVIDLLGDSINGLIFDSESEIPFSDSPAVAKILNEVHKYYPDAKPDPNMILGYAQAQLLVHTLEEAGADVDREKVRETLNSISGFDPGVMPMSYSDTKRFAASSVKVYQWRDNRPVALTDWLPIK